MLLQAELINKFNLKFAFFLQSKGSNRIQITSSKLYYTVSLQNLSMQTNHPAIK